MPKRPPPSRNQQGQPSSWRWQPLAGFAAALIVAVWGVADAVSQPPADVEPRDREEPTRMSDPPVLERIFVPASRPDLWPKGKWLPVEAKKLLPLLNRKKQARQPEQTFFSSAVYNATFDPDSRSLQDGTATLTLASKLNLDSNAPPRMEFIPLDPLNLALQSATWKSNSSPAIVGTNADGRTLLFAGGRSGDLTLAWKKPGRETPFGLEFDVAVPRAIVTKLQIHIPSGWAATTADADIPMTAGDDVRPWSIPIGLRNRVRIRLSPVRSTAPPAAAGNIAFQQNTRFAVGVDSLQGVAEFQITDTGPTENRLPDLLVPSEYRIDAIRDSANRPVLYKALSSTQEYQRVQLIPGPSGIPIVERFTLAFSPARPASSLNVPLKIPRLSQGVLLGNSRVNVIVAAPLAIATYAPNGMRLLETTPPDTDSGGGEFRLTFQHFQPDASLALELSRPGQTGSSIDVRELVLLQLDQTPPALIADLQLTASTREIFDFRALIPSEWQVNSVQLVDGRSAPSSPFADDRDISWKLRGESATHSRLTVDFADSLPMKRPVTLRLHVELPPGRSRTLSPVAVPDLSSKVEMALAVIAPGPGRPTLNSPLFRPVSRQSAEESVDWSTLTSATDDDTRFWVAGLWSGPDEALSARLLVPETVAEPDPESTEDSATRSEEAPIESSEPMASNASAARPVASAYLESRISPGTGHDEHALTWQFLYPVSGRVFEFTLPESARFLSAEWDSEQTPVNETEGQCSLPVPGAGNGRRLTIRYTLPSKEIFLQDTYRAAIPYADVGIAGFRWDVSVPQAFNLVSFSEDFSLADEGNDTSPADFTSSWLVWFFGPVARSVDGSAFNPLSVESWVEWTSQAPASAEEKSGWRTVSVESGSMPDSFAIHLCKSEQLHIAAWFLLIVSCLVGAGLRAGEVAMRSRIGLLWLTGCTISATFLPGAYAELVGAAVLGSFLSSIIPRSLLRRPPAPEEQPTQTASPRSMLSTISMQRIPTPLILGLVGAGSLVACFAQETEKSEELRIPILIPFDDQKEGTPAGTADVFYVDEAALSQLELLVPRADSHPTALITRAVYRSAVDQTGRPGLSAELSVAVRGQQEEITLGIPARFLTGRAECRFDDQPVRPLPDVSGKRIILSLPAASRTDSTGNNEWKLHSLSFELLPELAAADMSVSMIIPVPRVANSQFQIQFASTPASLKILESRLSAALLKSQVTWDLEPVSELNVEWNQNEALLASTPPKILCRGTAVIHPAWIDRRLTAKYEDRLPGRYVAWRFPSDAVIDIESVSTERIADVQVTSTPQGLVVVIEIESAEDGFLLEIPWRQARGNAALTQLDIEQPIDPFDPGQKLETAEYLAGLTPAPGFSFVPSNETSTETEVERTAAVDRWQSFWPEANRVRPADRILPAEATKSIAVDVNPVLPIRTARPTQLLQVSQNQVEVRFSAEVKVEQAAAFVHELVVPTQLAIDDITVLEDDVDRLSHWVRRGERLFLHLGSGTTGTQNIVLRGRLPSVKNGKLSFEEVKVEAATSEETVVQISRPQELTVSVESGLTLADSDAESTGSPASGDNESGNSSSLGREFRFTQEAQAAPRKAVIVVAEAAPRDQIQCLTVIRPDPVRTNGNSIHAELFVLARSLARPVLEIGFADWPIDPDAVPQASGADLDGQAFDADSKTLTLTLSSPVPELVSVVVSVELSRLVASDDETVANPALKPPAINAARLEQILAVSPRMKAEYESAMQNPLTAEGQLAEELALQVAGEDQELLASSVSWLSPLAFSIPRAIPAGRSSALVLHALMPGRKSSAIGLTRIQMVPQGDSILPLDWPKGLTPIAAYVNDRPQPVTVPREGRLHVPLSGDSNPHVVELLWQQTGERGGLKIRRVEAFLPSPRVPSVEPAAVIIIPSQGTSVLVDEEPDKEFSKSLLRNLEEWETRLPRKTGREILTTRILEALAPAEVLAYLTAESEADDETETPAPDPLSQAGRILSLLTARHADASSSGRPANSQIGIEGVLQNRFREDSLVTVPPNRPVSLWIIDDRLDGILTSLFVALLLLPAVWVLLSLETGERMAAWPTASWLLIGLIWWLCLRASPIGLLVAIASLARLAMQIPRSASR